MNEFRHGTIGKYLSEDLVSLLITKFSGHLRANLWWRCAQIVQSDVQSYVVYGCC